MAEIGASLQLGDERSWKKNFRKNAWNNVHERLGIQWIVLSSLNNIQNKYYLSESIDRD